MVSPANRASTLGPAPWDEVADGSEQSQVKMAERCHDRAHDPEVLV